MPGQVRELRVSAGVEVAQGDTLLVLEAMKMEIRIQAQGDGVVARVPVSAGEQVERDQVLIEITPQ
jgi:biotin carboxyl carrier protein